MANEDDPLKDAKVLVSGVQANTQVGQVGVDTRIVEASSTASSVLATTSVTALANNYPQISDAAEGIRININNLYVNPPSSEDQYEEINRELEARIAELEKAALENGIPLTQAYKCNEDRKACMASAPNQAEKRWCVATYIACIGGDVTKGMIQVGLDVNTGGE